MVVFIFCTFGRIHTTKDLFTFWIPIQAYHLSVENKKRSDIDLVGEIRPRHAKVKLNKALVTLALNLWNENECQEDSGQ